MSSGPAVNRLVAVGICPGAGQPRACLRGDYTSRPSVFMSSSHGDSKDAPGTYPVLDSHAPQAFDKMSPAMPQEAGLVNSSSSRASQQRQTVQRRQPALASSILLSEPYQPQAHQSSGGYSPQQVYPWFQQQRSGAFPQGTVLPLVTGCVHAGTPQLQKYVWLHNNTSVCCKLFSYILFIAISGRNSVEVVRKANHYHQMPASFLR